MTANQLSQRFLKWFQETYPDARIYRNNAGCFKTAAGSWVRYGIPNRGGADYIAFVPIKYMQHESGYDFILSSGLKTEFYEIKTLKDKMSKDQINFANMITNLGGDYFVVKELNKKEIESTHLNYTGHKVLTLDFSIEKWSVK